MTFDGVTLDIASLIALQHQAQGIVLSKQQARQRSIGGHMSPQRGRGMEFDEVRAYQPGDDVRSIDWRVTARTDRPHTKLYREERERPVMILVDLTASQFFGTKTQFKSAAAIRAASIFAWASVAAGDRVGGMIVTEHDLYEFQPALRHQAMLPFLQKLAECSHLTEQQPNSSENRLATAFSRLARLVRPGTLIVVLSDFYQLDGAVDQLRQFGRHQQLWSGLIYDPLEVYLPDQPSWFSDGESQLYIDAAKRKTVEAYRQQFEARIKAAKYIHQQSGMGFFTLATNDDLPFAIRQGLQLSRAQEVKYGSFSTVA